MNSMWKHRIINMILLIAGAYFIVGCVPEMKIGNEYLNKRQNITLVLMAPEWVKMVNLSPDSITSDSNLSQRENDSVKYYNSKILQHVSDSTLITNYIKNLKVTLEKQGYKTLIVNANDTLFPVKGNALLIKIGQIELDENVMPIRDETQYQGKLYAADYDLTKIELDFWIDVYKIENGQAVLPSRLLYDSFEKTDDFNGYFYWNNAENKMDYSEDIDEIMPKSVYDFASMIGTDHAIRLNTFLLNEYVAYYLPEKADRILLGINENYGTLMQIDEPPFQEIKDK